MWLQIIILACLVIFAVALTWRIARYARMPVHLRWELYPVAHEKNKPYGGSYLEEPEWWHRPRQINPLGEFNTFISEILLFKEYFRNKRDFWYFVYPFHIGLFLLLLWVALIILGAVVQVYGIPIVSASVNPWGQILYYLILVTGPLAFVLGIFGTIGLLVKRCVNEDLKKYTDPIDFLNLSCVLLIFITGFAMWLLEDRTFSVTLNYVQALFFQQPPAIGPLLTIFLLITSLFLAYMPFTRMLHFVAKYFTYHKVRWDDRPVIKDGQMEKEIGVLLGQTGDWSAPHIQQGGTWSEQVAGTGLTDKTDVK